MNLRFTSWATALLPKVINDLTISFDGKTICSTGKMDEYDKPLHILSAYLCEMGLTISKKTVYKKSNEIPAMRELLGLIDIHGCMIVADALHCQTQTAQSIIKGGGDYLLNVKNNQKALKQDIEDFVQDNELREEMDSKVSWEKNGGRIEFRETFVYHNVSWMEQHLHNWPGLSCFGAINRRFTINDTTSKEWHYYISSRKLTPEELMKYDRNEWAIESMHWLLDVHFDEDFSRIRYCNARWCRHNSKMTYTELFLSQTRQNFADLVGLCQEILTKYGSKRAGIGHWDIVTTPPNQNLNIIRKIALNYIRKYKNESNSKLPLSRLMFACLLECEKILEIINWQ